MAHNAGEARGDLPLGCGSARFFVGSPGQIWADTALMVVAILAEAFFYRALRHHWPVNAAVAFLVLAVGLIGFLFVRQLLRGERGWMFYTAMLLFAGMSDPGDVLAAAGVAPNWVATASLLAAASAVVGIVGAVRIVRALDEMWRQVNHRALAFAFITTLSLVLGQWLLSRFGVEVLTWRSLLLLMVVAWGVGMLWEYRRLR